ncbi:hypothetical protein D3C72_904310 [compost metagenome]
MILTLTKGSSVSAMVAGSGHFTGLSTMITSPLLVVTLYSTEGAVVIKLTLYSRSRRSWMISRCNRPKKPQRKPKPKATEVSGSHWSEASFSVSFSRASRSSGYSSAEVG